MYRTIQITVTTYFTCRSAFHLNPSTVVPIISAWVQKHYSTFHFNKTNKRTNFPKFILSRNSTCFVQFLCPSSGGFPLYVRHWYMSCRSDDGCQASLAVLDSHGTLTLTLFGSSHQTCMKLTSAECTVENS